MLAEIRRPALALMAAGYLTTALAVSSCGKHGDENAAAKAVSVDQGPAMVFASDQEATAASVRALSGDAKAAGLLSWHFYGADPELSAYWQQIAFENGLDREGTIDYAFALFKAGGYCKLLRAEYVLSRGIELPQAKTDVDPQELRAKIRGALSRTPTADCAGVSLK